MQGSWLFAGYKDCWRGCTKHCSYTMVIQHDTLGIRKKEHITQIESEVNLPNLLFFKL